MFSYPEKLPFEILQSEHPEYTALMPVWEKIDLLSAGGHRLEKSIAKFLPKRFEEPPEIYKQRIEKFTHRNILGDALKHQVNKLENGVISVAGFPEGSSEASFWQDFRSNTDGKNRSEMALVSRLASMLLKFKYAYIQVDRPMASFAPRNRAEDELLGNPYLLLHQPQTVINWGESSDGLTWVKLRTLTIDTSNPFLPEPVYVATWTYIDSQFIAKYSAPVELDKNGKIKSLAKQQSGEINPLEAVAIGDRYPLPHGINRLPVFRVEIKDELWACDQASGKAYEHLRLDCHKFDLLTFAYFQRYYNKQKRPDGNLPGGRSALLETYVDDDQSPNVGLEYVPELEAFQFAEPSGAIIEHINNSLERIESEVEQLLDLTGATTQPGRVEQQSGYAREFDFVSQNDSLKSYGSILIEALREAYSIVQAYRGSSIELNVTGLDSFEVDTLGNLIENLNLVSKLDFVRLQESLPATLFFLLYEKLCMLLSSNIAPDLIQAMKAEIAGKTFSNLDVEDGDRSLDGDP